MQKKKTKKRRGLNTFNEIAFHNELNKQSNVRLRCLSSMCNKTPNGTSNST